MRLFLASLFTLFLLFSFLAALFLSLLYVVGFINIYLLFGLTILFNFILWLIGPKISDFIYRFFYKVHWISIEELKEICPTSANTIIKTCEKYNFNIPKLGIIPDKNPNAFTYGSGRWNARIIATEGIFEYLDENERSSVYAHEVGHIKNRDFIIMTIASTILQLLYEIYVVSRIAVRSSRGGKKSGGDAILLAVAIFAFIFYWIGQYVVLYLSRVREYYADEFSAKETNPNYLISALIKIAYGILSNPDEVRLLNSTKYVGIVNFNLSKNIGLIYYNCKNLGDFKPLAKALLYDIKNPWAFISELGSTHPLTGKRIERLCKLSSEPLFDFEKIIKENTVDEGKLRSNFLKDALVLITPFLFAIGYPIVYFVSVFLGYIQFSLNFIAQWLILSGLGIILFTIYKYPGKEPQHTTVIELMSDIYTSPVRGKSVNLNGKIIGRGIPGLIFSEDMMFQDNTGLIYLNYQSWLPILGNLIFGLTKVSKLVNKEAKISGWFLRGSNQWIGLKKLETSDESITGFVKWGGLIGGLFFMLIGIVLYLWFTTI